MMYTAVMKNLLVLCVLMGCGSGDDKPSDSGETPSSTTSATTTATSTGTSGTTTTTGTTTTAGTTGVFTVSSPDFTPSAGFPGAANCAWESGALEGR